MKNIYFPEEDITENDLFFVCSMIERVARHIKQQICGKQNRLRQSAATTLHCRNASFGEPSRGGGRLDGRV